jgi:hypothetical protein
MSYFRSTLIGFACALVLIIPPSAIADDTAIQKSLIIEKISTDPKISIDGILTEQAWSKADWYTEFTQSEPQYTSRPSEETHIAFLYDDENLYIAVKCFESSLDNIFASKLRHRDSVYSDDIVEIVFDTYRDQVRGYLFVTNPLGAKDESQINGPGQYNWNWDDSWEVETEITEQGWQAEFRIPLSILSFATAESNTWGVNARRVMRTRNEKVYMTPPPPPFDISSLNYSLSLRGFKNLERQRNIQVIPYSLVKGTTDENDQTDANFDAGADVKYAVNSDLVLDLTANTDFAQVEADNQQVNLSRYSLFYPEKRDFFLENAQLFSFNPGFGYGRSLMPFFSRRIGLYEDSAVPILAGARLSGKISGNDIGLLSVQTDSVDTLNLEKGFYNVARLRRNLDGRSFIGGIVTTSDRGDFSSRTYGVDGQWFFSNQLFLTGYYTAVDEAEIGSDANAYGLTLDYTSDPYGWAITTNETGENYSPDLGFVPRKGIRQNNIVFRRSWRLQNRSIVRRFSLRGSSNWTENVVVGDMESTKKGLHSDIELESGGKIDINIDHNYEQLFNTFILSDDIAFAPGEYNYYTTSISYESSEARRWQTDLRFQTGGYFGGDRDDVSLSLRYIFSKHFNMTAQYSQYNISHEEKDLRWKIFRTRLNYIHSAHISLSGLFQYNSSTGSYITNIRLRWIHSNDSDFFIVINDVHTENELEKLELVGREAIIKINYRFFL